MMKRYDGRPQRDKHAIARKAAVACVDEGVAIKDAMGRFAIGRPSLLAAIKALRAEREAAEHDARTA
jgi:hypothetical protein